MKEKILILSGPYGEGHRQAARALVETCKLTRPHAEAVVVDFMEWTLPRLHGISKTMFHQGVQKFPHVYGYLFRRTRRQSPISSMMSNLRWYGLKRICKLLEEVKPTVVVSTFPLAASAMSAMKMAQLVDVPCVTVITDHTDHSYWIHPGTDAYLVGSDKVRRALLALGIADSRITVTGIPIRPHFCEERGDNASALREKLGLDPSLPTVLIMGGGYGMLDKGLIRMLDQYNGLKMQYVVICGYNDKLRAKLEERLADGGPHRVVLLGYVTNMEQYMAAADLIVTKPGGLTTSEALAMRLPMLLYRPLPGQEEDNADFLTSAQVAVRAESEDELHAWIRRLFVQRELLQAMRQHAELLHAESASFAALEVIFSSRSAHPIWEKHVMQARV